MASGPRRGVLVRCRAGKVLDGATCCGASSVMQRRAVQTCGVDAAPTWSWALAVRRATAVQLQLDVALHPLRLGFELVHGTAAVVCVPAGQPGAAPRTNSAKVSMDADHGRSMSSDTNDPDPTDAAIVLLWM